MPHASDTLTRRTLLAGAAALAGTGCTGVTAFHRVAVAAAGAGRDPASSGDIGLTYRDRVKPLLIRRNL